MSIKWSTNYLVGIDQIDEQHAELIRKMSELAQISKLNGNQEQFDELLAFLEDYIEKHLRLEEALMVKYKYPDINNHFLFHENFRRNLSNVKSANMRGGLSMQLAIQIQRELIHWFADHIQQVDKLLGQFLSRQL